MIANLTQHNATPEQRKEGVFDLNAEDQKVLFGLLTFNEIPTKACLVERAEKIVKLIPIKCYCAMIGGAPFFMGYLERACHKNNVECYYAFSKREVTEVAQQDGSVRKVAVFNHVGFVKAAQTVL